MQKEQKMNNMIFNMKILINIVQHLYLLDGLLHTYKTMRTAGSYHVVSERSGCDETFDKPAPVEDNWKSKNT